MVEEVSPPMTTMASGPAMKTPALLRPSAMGSRARMVAMAVIRMGRRRRRPPSTTAALASSPLARY